MKAKFGVNFPPLMHPNIKSQKSGPNGFLGSSSIQKVDPMGFCVSAPPTPQQNIKYLDPNIHHKKTKKKTLD